MGKITFEELLPAKESVDENSLVVEELVKEIVAEVSCDLDKYIEFIRQCLRDGENPPTNEELDDFCMNLSTLIYFTSGKCEYVGIKDDISKAVYKEVYNNQRNAVDGGTVADKNTIAELESQREQMVNVCYNRAYKILKAKVENAQELLGSCKKVLSRRMGEQELTRMQR